MEELKQAVREKYGQAARAAASGGAATCCGSSCGCGPDGAAPADPHFVTRDLYSPDEAGTLPDGAVRASLGCGNPTALTELREGEVVLDLGSGGGIDVLLSARRVGPAGRAYGLDMTDEMLDLARSNARAAGAENVEFLRGEMEDIPLPDASVDVVISNCVINLSADKRRVLQEAYRVLRPGGRFAVSDVVVQGELPPAVRKNMELHVGCLAGALREGEFLDLLGEVGFRDASIEPTRIYDLADARAMVAAAGEDGRLLDDPETGRIVSAFVRAHRPGAAPREGFPGPGRDEADRV